MGQQEVLPEGAVGAEAAFEGLVADVRQLVVQQCLLVLADKLAELALESGGQRKGGSVGGGGCSSPMGLTRDIPAVGDSLDMREQVHLEGVALLKGLSTLQGAGCVGWWTTQGGAPPPPHPVLGPLTLSHIWGFSVLCVFMCCVSLFCMGYTRPHTGQGKELSFGVWGGTRGGRMERPHFPPPPRKQPSGRLPSQAWAPDLPDLASSSWRRKAEGLNHHFSKSAQDPQAHDIPDVSPEHP